MPEIKTVDKPVLARCQTPKQSYTFDYPEAIAFADTQEDVFWTAREIEVSKDIQDIRVNMTGSEAHGVITTLKLFTLYEIVAGRDYWLGRVMKRFPRPDIEQMAATFGFTELKIHAPFYNKINEALMLNTDEFYLSYVDNPVLKERMEFIEGLVCDPDDLLSLGAFSMVEGGVLYSAFAFLKHFQSRGKNKLKNVVSGINFSVRDENLHCEGGSWLFNTLLEERNDLGLITDAQRDALKYKLQQAALKIAEHEFQIVDMIFEKGKMDGINKDSLKTFIKSRINVCLSKIGIPPVFKDIGDNPIAEWFYKGINLVSLNDFFSGVGNGYNRNWRQQAFIWRTDDE